MAHGYRNVLHDVYVTEMYFKLQKCTVTKGLVTEVFLAKGQVTKLFLLFQKYSLRQGAGRKLSTHVCNQED